MSKTPSLEKTAQNRRTAVTLSAVFTLFVASLTGYAMIVLPDASLTNPTVLLGLIVTIAAGWATWFSYKGYPQPSIAALSGMIMVGAIAYQFAQVGNGLLNSLLSFTLIAGLSTAVLSGKWLRRVLSAAGLTAVLIIFIDLFGPTNRPTYSYSVVDYILFALFIGILLFMASRHFHNFSLQSKILSTFIGLMVLTVTVLTIIITRSVNEILTQRVSDELQTEAQGQRDVINFFFHDKISQIQVLALNNALRTTLEARNASYTDGPDDILTQIQELDGQWITAAADDPFILSVITPDPAINATAFQLSDLHENLPEHIEIFVTDRYGATVAATGRLSDYYQADEAWWQAAWNEGQGAVYISDPEFDESANANALLVAVPVYGEDGQEVLGILRSTLAIDALFAVIGGLEFGETGHAVLLNPAGEVLYNPLAANGPVHLPSELIHELVAIEETLYGTTTDEHGHTSVFGHAHLHTIDEIDVNDRSLGGQIANAIFELGWIVVVQQEASEALASVVAINRTVQLIGLGILLLTSIAAVFLARTMTRPLQVLNQAAQTIDAGQLDVVLPATGDDEIGQLAHSFEQMTSRLRQTLGSLQARTNDLSLVVEVGQQMTRVQGLEEMLQNAVNLIRERFDLYYAQVYLADPTGSSLILRAGTGTAGQKLVQRGHRLPVDANSINGTAAAQQQPVVVADTSTSRRHRQNPLLPATRSEMAVPLMADERLIGVLDLQSDRPHGLTEDNVRGFTALAAQLAVAIQNAMLFTETQQARAEVEAYTQRLVQQGWQDFLDGIERSQHLVAAYDLAQETPLSSVPEIEADEHELVVPIAVAGRAVGAVRLGDYEGRAWTEDEAAILTAVAEKAARHIENLRLLTEAQKYRAEAEAVTRRLTREGWQSYQEQANLSARGFVYNQQEVLPWSEASEETAVNWPLTVRGETIGELAIANSTALSPEVKNLIQAMTDKISERLESLRLAHQVELSLAETEEQAYRLAHLNELGNALSAADTINDAFKAVAERLGDIVPHDRLSITMLDAEKQQLEVFALNGSEGAIPIDTVLPVTGTAVGAAVTQQQLLNVNDLLQSNYLENPQLVSQGLQATLIVPLITGRAILGTLNLGSRTLAAFDDQDENMMRQIATLLASTIESQRLFSEIQSQAKRERLLNTIGQKIRSTVTVESALQTAIQELGEALQAQHAQLNLTVANNGQSVVENGRHKTITQS